MAVPKNKTSHARKSSRRSTVWKINAPELTACPNCGELTAVRTSSKFRSINLPYC